MGRFKKKFMKMAMPPGMKAVTGLMNKSPVGKIMGKAMAPMNKLMAKSPLTKFMAKTPVAKMMSKGPLAKMSGMMPPGMMPPGMPPMPGMPLAPGMPMMPGMPMPGMPGMSALGVPPNLMNKRAMAKMGPMGGDPMRQLAVKKGLSAGRPGMRPPMPRKKGIMDAILDLFKF